MTEIRHVRGLTVAKDDRDNPLFDNSLHQVEAGSKLWVPIFVLEVRMVQSEADREALLFSAHFQRRRFFSARIRKDQTHKIGRRIAWLGRHQQM